ncbi:MAG: AMP-binding protein [Acidobacteria bacterium]|nr:AMP-binding protein [Acidobacteriota bacterium]
MQETNAFEDQPFAWTPTPDVIERSRLMQFMRQVGVSTWDELYEFSIRDVENFTEEVLKFLEIKFDPSYEKLLDTSNGVELPKWFTRTMNTPVRLIAKHEHRNADTPVRTEGEARTTADTPSRLSAKPELRTADTPVRTEGEARTTSETFANKRGWHERGYLPHFDGFETQFVTFRLADSLPQNVLKRLEQELSDLPREKDSDEYREMVEQYLDQGIGACILKDPEIAKAVMETIAYEDGRSSWVTAWVIMPNHVHLLVRPLQGHSLSDIMKRIKGVSARKINQLTNSTGSVWQPDYFDRYIRDTGHFDSTIRYIKQNPVKAGLCAAPEEWEFSSFSPQAASADRSVRGPAGLNITEMCLDRWQTDEIKEQPAVIWEGEDGGEKTTTYAGLLDLVERCAAGLRTKGIGKGDAIAIHLPMTVETVAILLSINRIGAIAMPVFSGYGVEAIASRLNAVKAKAIFTCDGFERRGKFYHAFPTAEEAVSHCETIEHIFALKFGKEEITYQSPTVNFCDFVTLIAAGDDVHPEPTAAEDPLIILYTSGTTGKPKGIAHTHASFPIKAAQDMAFGTDVGKGTRICWYTDLGWMMGPWLIYGALINGATICIYDGAPDYPTPDRMWEFCAKHEVEVLGISPTLVRSLAASEGTADTPVRPSAKHEQTPSGEIKDADKSVRGPFERHDLSALRILASTGEPWNPAPWWWLFEKVGNSKLPIINYSGGTEIAGGILMGNPLLPIKPCSFPAPCPGMDVDIFGEDGKPVERGHVGELVIKQPWIGMARGFWEEKERYLAAYWSRFKGIWVHGDWAMEDADGCWYILGRSDDTLKVAGKRVGPAEVESILVSYADVVEAAVIGVPDEVKGTAMVAFCVLSETGSSATGLDASLKALVAHEMGKPLAPSKIHFVGALPKTRNAKVMRRVIRAAYLGQDAGDLSSLENPNAIDAIRELNDR